MLNMSKISDDDNVLTGWWDSKPNFKYWLFLVSMVPSHVSKIVQWFGSSTVHEVLLQMCIFKVKLIQVAKLLTQPSPYFLHDQPLPN